MNPRSASPTSSPVSSSSPQKINPNWDPVADPVPVPKGSITIQKRGAQVTSEGLNHQITVFSRALEMFAGLLSQKDVRLINRGTDCFTTGSTIVIPELSILDRKGMTEEEVQKAGEFLEAVRGFVSHEVAHVLYSDLNAKEVREFVKGNPLNQIVWNSLEDLFAEYRMMDLWRGVGLDLSNMNEWTRRKLCEPVRWSNIAPLMKVLYGFMDLALYRDNRKAAWFYNGLGQTYKDAISTIEDEIDAVYQCKKSKDVVEVAKRVVEKLKKFSAEGAPEGEEDEDEESETGNSQPADPQGPEPLEEDPQPGIESDEETEAEEGEEEGEGEGSEGEGSEEGEGEDGDEEEGEEGSGDAEGEEGEGGGDAEDEEEGEEDEEEGGTEGEAEGDESEEGDEGEESEEGSSGAGKSSGGDKEDPEGNDGDEGKKQDDLLGLNDVEKDPNAVYNPETSNLLTEEAKKEAAKMTTRDGRYLIYTTEFDKIGNSDDLKSQLTSHRYAAKVDELAEKKLYGEISRKADQHVGVLRRRLRSLLTSQVKPKHHRDLEDGDLDFNSLWKLTLKKTSEQGRVFQRTTYTFDNKDVCVALAINESGSMSNAEYSRCESKDPTTKKTRHSDPNCAKRGYCYGHYGETRIQLAREVAIIFGEVLSDLGVSFKVYGHTAEPTPVSEQYYWGGVSSQPGIDIYTRFGALVLITYKDWEERYTTVKHRMVRMDARSNTYDGEALMRVARDILQRKERRKVIFMLDDGIPEPSDHNAVRHRKYLKEVVKEVTKQGVEVISLGMATDAVKEYYPNSVVIREAADTPMVAAAELKKILMKSMRRA